MLAMIDEDASLRAIEACRRINRRAAERCVEHGVSPEDAAIAAVYSAHDLAQRAGRDAVEALEWMRTAIDVMESQLLPAGRGH